jgi:hypothetical protein
MGEIRIACNILIGKPEMKRPFEDLHINGKITLEWILRK